MELLGGQGADILTVEEAQLDGIEDRRRLGNAMDIKGLDHLREREDFLFTLGAPAQQQDVVEDGFLEVALSHQILIGGSHRCAWRACGWRPS